MWCELSGIATVVSRHIFDYVIFFGHRYQIIVIRFMHSFLIFLQNQDHSVSREKKSLQRILSQQNSCFLRQTNKTMLDDVIFFRYHVLDIFTIQQEILSLQIISVCVGFLYRYARPDKKCY